MYIKLWCKMAEQVYNILLLVVSNFFFHPDVLANYHPHMSLQSIKCFLFECLSQWLIGDSD